MDLDFEPDPSSNFWKMNWCAHEATTPKDPSGGCVCLDCGEYVAGILNDLHAAFDAIWRDYGMSGRHSKRCVMVDDGWVCADDCGIAKRSQ